MAGEPTFLIIVFGTRKMPLPITVPTTIAAALQTPRTRFRPVSGSRSMGTSGMFRLWQHQRCGTPRQKGRDRADRHVPGERYMSPCPDAQNDSEAGGHRDHSGGFSHESRQQAQQENPEKRAIKYARDRQPRLEDGAP